MDITSTLIPRDELLKLCAIKPELYARTFFPRAYRQLSPPFAEDLWEPLENTDDRLVNLICFRGAGKTTRLRTFTSRRIAYGTSRTVLYIGASERDAIRSVQWLRTQVERNRTPADKSRLGWADTFGLEPGRKWEETQIEINHTVFKHTVWVLAAGVTGSLRGINFDDYRPDLIIVDDPQTDEMAATEEQRNKVTDLVLGAVKNSLAPVIDDPNAKLVMAITPQHKDDISQQTLKDPQWTSRVFPCWTKETKDLAVEKQVSSWPERFPTLDLRADKMAAIRRRKLSIFSRELECKLTTPESSIFLPSWLNIREHPNSGPRGCFSVLAIDPVPPPSDRQMARGLEGKDWEAHYVWGRHGGNYHLLDRDRSRGHDPSWSIATAFRLARQWRVARIIVDAVNYQRTLKWLLEEEMRRRRIFYSVMPVADGMKKFARINNVLNGLATQGRLWIGPEHTEFAEQFEQYGPLYQGYDDDLDASALALQDLSNPYLEAIGDGADAAALEGEVEDFPFVERCP